MLVPLLAAAAVACLAAVAAGVALIYPPAGLITAGVLGLPALYVAAALITGGHLKPPRVRRRSGSA